MTMSAVVIAMSMSLDGYAAHPDDNPGILHEWMFGDSAGDPGEGLSGPDKSLLDELRNTSGAMIAGRRLYDITHGWGGSHPFGGIPLFVVSHHAPDVIPEGSTPVTFVRGVTSAVEQAVRAAGGKNVYVVGGASIDRQLLEAGLVDELWISVVPVLLGEGVRLFNGIGGTQILLDQQTVTASERVAHLRYRVVVSRSRPADDVGLPVSTRVSPP
jgi:dihydrofolate reductase